MIDKRLNFKGGGGSDNRPTMADIAGPVTAPTTSLPITITLASITVAAVIIGLQWQILQVR
jgi:lysozyme family protein